MSQIKDSTRRVNIFFDVFFHNGGEFSVGLVCLVQESMYHEHN